MINLYKLHNEPEQLYGYDRVIQVPKMAWEHSNDDQKKKLESLWAKDPKLAYLYAVNVLHKRFPAGEDVIARNESYSYLYAKHILRDSDPGSWAERYLASRKAK